MVLTSETPEDAPLVVRESEALEIPRRGLGTFDALRIRDFRLLLFGTTLANAAEWVQQVTLSWLVYDMTGSGAALGTMNLVRSSASLSLAPVAGVVIDRVPRGRLMLIVAVWLAVLSLILGGLLLSGYQALWLLFGFTFLGGVAGAFDMPLRQTVVFTLVPRHMASNAVGLIQTGWGVTRSIGPAIGGFMILAVGAGGNFLIEAVVYSVIAMNILRMTFPPMPPAGNRPAFFQNLREGVAFAASSRVTRSFMLMGWVLPLFIIPNFTALPPIFAKEVFDGGADTMGLLLSSIGVGGIFGGLVASSVGVIDRRGLVQLGALFCVALSLVAFALCPTLLLAMVAFAFAGFFEMIFLAGNQALIQLSIPDHLRGRVTSITALQMLLSPLGAVTAGFGADLIGPREISLVISSIAAGLAVLILLLSPTVRNYRTSEALRTDGHDGP